MAILLTVFALAAHPAFAQDSGDPFVGHELAMRRWASCHVVDAATQRQGTDSVPGFAAIAAMPSPPRPRRLRSRAGRMARCRTTR